MLPIHEFQTATAARWAIAVALFVAAGFVERNISAADPVAAKPAEVTLKVADKAAFEALLKANRGKVVVVDYWATWCVPCVKDFHKTVAWTDSFAKDQVVVVTVCLDDLEDQERSLGFLKKKQATSVNLISKNGSDEKSFLDHGIDGGALPHFKVYDRTGKLVRKFGSEDPCDTFDHKDVESAIRAALDAKN